MKKPVNWLLVEATMRRSICGERLTDEEQSLLQRAHARFPAKYAALHKTLKQAEVDRMAMRDPK